MNNSTVRPMIAGLFLLAAAAAAPASVVTANPTLPPDTGSYVSNPGAQAIYNGGGFQVILQNLSHTPIAASAVRTPIGPDEQEVFNSAITGDASANGSPFQSVSGSGPTTTLVHNKIGNVTGTFQTEMLAMNLTSITPFGPIMIRESPTIPSLGQTTITNIGGGNFRIDSFFDVFTELSIDGGQTWIPDSQGPTHVTLMPAPGAGVLLGLGALVGLRRRRK